MSFSLPHIKPLNDRSEDEKAKAKKNDAASHAHLKSLWKVEGNNECADCTSRLPGWAALPHGVFICIDCAQLHRHIGRHISQVKAINTGTYLWYPDEIECMEKMGNARANAYYLGHPSAPKAKPSQESSRQEKEDYIRNKYERKKWVHPNPSALLAPVAAHNGTPSPSPNPPKVSRKSDNFFDFDDWAAPSAPSAAAVPSSSSAMPPHAHAPPVDLLSDWTGVPSPSPTAAPANPPKAPPPPTKSTEWDEFDSWASFASPAPSQPATTSPTVQGSSPSNPYWANPSTQFMPFPSTVPQQMPYAATSWHQAPMNVQNPGMPLYSPMAGMGGYPMNYSANTSTYPTNPNSQHPK